MNRFDHALGNRQLNGWISDNWKKVTAVIANPTVALNVGSTPGGTKAVKATAAELQRSEIAQAAAATLLNPTLAFQGTQAKLAKENPKETALLAAIALTALSGGAAATAAAGGQGAAAAGGSAMLYASGAAAAGDFAKALHTGVPQSQAEKAAINAGMNAAIGTGINYLQNSGLDLSSLVNMLGAEKVQQFVSGKVDPQTAAEINRVIGQLKAEGKTDSQIIGELMQSDWFRSLATRNAEQLTHPILFNEAYNALIKMGYDHNTANRAAMSFANQYAPQTAARGVQTAIQKGPMNLDPKLLLAVAAIVIPILMMR
jgi:hypothetical protein